MENLKKAASAKKFAAKFKSAATSSLERASSPLEAAGKESEVGTTSDSSSDLIAARRRAAAEHKYRTEKWITEMRVDKHHLLRIETFASMLGANVNSRWDLGMHFEACDVYLEALLRIRKGHTPLLPYETAESGKELLVPAVDMLSAIESVCAKWKAVERQAVKVELEASLKVLHQGKLWIPLDKGLQHLIGYWKHQVYDNMDARLESIFVSADDDNSGDLDYPEFIELIEKIGRTEHSTLNPRSMLRMYSQMSLHEKVDAAVFAKVSRSFELAKISVGKGGRPRRDTKAAEERATVFKLLKSHWQHLEGKVLPLVCSLKRSTRGNVMEEIVNLLRTLLREEEDAENAVHCFRCVVADMPPAVRAEFKEVKDLEQQKRTNSKLSKDAVS